MWDFSLGSLSADITIPHFASLQRLARSFAKNFVDEDNTTSGLIESVSLPDVTYLSARLESLDINVWSQNSAVNISLPCGIAARFNDYIAECALSRLQVNSHCVQAKGLIQSGLLQWTEVTSVDFGLAVDMATASDSLKLKEIEQCEFLAQQDLETGRCQFLYSQATEAPVYAGECRHFPISCTWGVREGHNLRFDSSGSLYNTLLHAGHRFSPTLGPKLTSKQGWGYKDGSARHREDSTRSQDTPSKRLLQRLPRPMKS